jgi:hypothetical protein
MTGIDNTLHSFYPGPGDLPNLGSQEPPSSEIVLDMLLDDEGPLPSYLQLRTNRTITLPPGSLSLIELTKIISAVISKLREALNNSELLDSELSRKFNLASFDTASGILDNYSVLSGQLDAWSGPLSSLAIQIDFAYTLAEVHRQTFTDAMIQTTANDIAAKNEVNPYIDIYNDPDALESFANTQFEGDQQAAIDFINGKIQAYNDYMASRPNLQALLNNYTDAVANYNNLVDQANAHLSNTNSERIALGLPSLPLVDPMPTPSGNIQSYLPHEGQMPSSLPLVSLPAGSTNIDHIDATPTISDVPSAAPPADIPRVPYAEAFALLWLPETMTSLAFLSSFNRILDLAEALRTTENFFYREMGYNIIFPAAFIQRSPQIFLDSVGILGGGGLAAFALGLHSRNLEIALSSGILRSIAMNYSMPITGRLFARLQFTALELLQRSSLLSPLPALRFIASQMGFLAASSPAINVAISLAITEQVLGMLGSGVVRQIVNSQMNRLPLFARLANDINLLNTFGLMSIGGLASFTRAVSATMSLSILSVALAHLGRSIGLPSLVPQMFAQLAGIPTIDILVAMTAGSRILDVLDNPFSILALKQTLVDSLVFGRGFGNVAAGIMINSAVNAIILHGGLNNFSNLQYQLVNEYQAAGFNFFQAHQLANETVALIRGDIGVNYLNAAFGLNFDRSIVASSIVNNILGIDIGFAGAMMSNAVVRSLLLGGFGSTVRLQSELTAQFQNIGLNFNDAAFLAQQMTSLVSAAGTVIPLTRYPGITSLLLGNQMLTSIAFGTSIARDELRNNFQAHGLNYFQADFLATQIMSLAARTYVTPGNLFEIALEAAIGRAGTSFQTQREFRDALFNELRGVGFSFHDAMFLANAAAAFGLDGSLVPLFGVTPLQLTAIESAAVNRISGDLGVSAFQAQAIYDEAEARTLSRGPYSNGDQFHSVLREEVHRSILMNTGRGDGNVIFDRAIADLASPTTILSLAGLVEQISNSVLGLLRPDLGARLAQEIKDQILLGLLGGTSVDEIEDPERRNPLSVLNQLEDALHHITQAEEEAEMRETLRKLIQLLRALMTPNAEMGFLLQSLTDGPSTLIGSILGSQQPIGACVDR